MKTILRSSGLLLLAMSGLLAQSVKSDYDKSTAWERYHTFAWKDGARPATGPVDNSLLQSRIHSAFSAELSRRGFTAAGEHPDVYLTYHVNVKPEKDIVQTGGFGPGWYGRRYGYGGFGGGTTFTNRYLAETILVDMVDARTGQLLWRAYISDTASKVPDLESTVKIEKMAHKAFKDFPRKQA